MPDRDRLVAIALMCAALFYFACLDASGKWLNHVMDPVQTTFIRYLGSVILVLAVLNPVTRPGVLRARRPGLQLFRSLMGLLATAFNIIALQHLQLAETMSIMFATPFFVALLTGPLLGEWPGVRQITAIVVGFAGVLVVTRPGLNGLHPVALLSVAGALCYAFYNVATRVLAGSDSSETTMVYSGVAGVVLLAPVMPQVWTMPDSWLVWAVAIAIGAFGAIGHWLLIIAHRRASALVLAPFIYTEIVWMIALGFVVFGDVPDRWTLLGALIVIGSGLYLLGGERKTAGPAVVDKALTMPGGDDAAPRLQPCPPQTEEIDTRADGLVGPMQNGRRRMPQAWRGKSPVP
ncbi:DMT family transporter [Bradyrhizobium sp. 2TAF24]|uniref:DMT family transporter n=1 Tax=Bradyrhizobium sp. 2TAF24 TaxID=3233011 RepID=UPI003F918643